MNCNKIIGLVTTFIVGIFLLFPCSVGADDGQNIIIITNKSVPADSLKQEDVKNIFIGKMTSWSNNEKINFATLPNGDEIHRAFLKKFVKRTPMQYSRYWKKQIFTGKGKTPKSFETEKDLLEYVATTKGAIGYITTGQISDGINDVKVLTIQ
jgi:ABC-type phosphate transport system substrate-binding protein